ncbi:MULTISPECIES: transglutaminase domain-containing protein [unclassified Streptomyces]|uniref:transglutaminase domain-containing protein n=1 Tax=unclassified Streptomyces TaxID=2593676 RepID=UPI00364E6E24
MTDDALNYAQPGPFTSLDGTQLQLIEGMPNTPVGICAAVQQLVIQPGDAAASGIPESRIAEKNIRRASELVTALTALEPVPLHHARTPEKRVIGTCRHFATLACAVLRARGFTARARCGFATYFQEGRGVDHWITEYWDGGQARWVRIDTEILGRGNVDRPQDLARGEFLSGGEAWVHYRNGLIDPDTFGVSGTDHAWGWAEISGNAVRDLAALCKQETLPWDEWGRMTAAYEGRTGPEYDQLIDVVADTCAKDDPPALMRLFAHQDLAVPQHMLG